ncbi:MAG: hypothetical protein KatS3mg117_3336 [Geminicoccaceae bacterium]|nr:MAG: hypothetical protein KatS3mg117_3336 [Geminicoccaceae bacterium]
MQRPSSFSTRLVALAATLSLLAGRAAADEAPTAERPAWAIVERVGTVRARPLDSPDWHPLAAPHLTPGVEIEVGPNGRLVLESGGDRITAEAGSRLLVYSAAERPHLVGQPAGTVRYAVARRGPRRFQVETPLLAITVKGTAFAVEVAGEAARVSVEEGRVAVAPPGAADPVELGAGESLRRDVGGGLEVATTVGAPAGPGERGRASGRATTERSTPEAGVTADPGPRAAAVGAPAAAEPEGRTGRGPGSAAAGDGRGDARDGNGVGNASGGGAGNGSGGGGAGNGNGQGGAGSGSGGNGNSVGGGNGAGGSGTGGGNGNGGGGGNGQGGGNGGAGGNGGGPGDGGGNGNGGGGGNGRR